MAKEFQRGEYGRPEENDLEIFLRITRGDEGFYMGLLHAKAVISDNAVTAADVAREDAERAVVRLMGRNLEKVVQWLESAF